MLSVQLDTSFFFKLKYTFDVLDFNKVTMIIQMWVGFFFFFALTCIFISVG